MINKGIETSPSQTRAALRRPQHRLTEYHPPETRPGGRSPPDHREQPPTQRKPIRRPPPAPKITSPRRDPLATRPGAANFLTQERGRARLAAGARLRLGQH